MPRRGENIYHRKDGRWEGRYVKQFDAYTGKKSWGSVYGRDYAECRKKLQSAKAGLLPDIPRSQTLTVGEWLDEWLKLCCQQLRPSTRDSYLNMIERHIKPKLGQVRLSRITNALIQEFLDEKLLAGRLDGQGGLARSTVQVMAHILRSAIEEAGQRQLVGEIAFSKLKKGTEAKREVKVYTLEEQSRLTRCAEALCVETPAYLSILLAIDTGLRVGEICALRWQDVALREGIVHVNRTLQRIRTHSGVAGAPKTSIVVGPPKSKHSQRSVPLSQGLRERLLQYYETLPPEERRGEAFVFGKKGTYMEPRSIQRYLNRVIARAGVPKLKFHALRHTFATRAVEAGVDVKSLSEILGHSSVQITLNVYVHSNLEQKRHGIELIQKYLTMSHVSEGQIAYLNRQIS